MTAILWTAAEIAAATGGRPVGDWSVTGVSIDSRTLAAGDLFIALRGPNHDGHDFVAAALERGAACLIDQRAANLPADAPVVEVGDTLQALTDLGRAARARSPARIAAITGSVGKTGTKEALRLALQDQGGCHASAASYNNHWGVPLSLARAPLDPAYGVYELGMNAAGEIRALTRLVRPHVALVTTVAPAHLGFFASVAAIASAKGEIFEGLEPDGIAVLPADNEHCAQLRRLAAAAGCTRVIGFGAATAADVRLLDARLTVDGSEVVADLHGERIAYRIGAPGRHWVINSLAVLATAQALGAAPAKAAAALAEFRAPAGRGRQARLALQDGAFTLIDESYNANPTSVRAALDVLAGTPGRRMAALGDMLELGDDAPRLHAELAAAIAAGNLDQVFTVGPMMRHLHEALAPAQRGAHVDEAGALLPILASTLRPGDVLLVKGSLGVRMGSIVENLRAQSSAHQRLCAEGV